MNHEVARAGRLTPRSARHEGPGIPLAHVLGELSVERFIAEHWGQRPLHLPGAARVLDGLFGASSVGRWAKVAEGREERYPIKAQATLPGNKTLVPIRLEHVERMLRAGSSVMLADTHHVAPEQTRLMEHWLKELGFAARYSCSTYLSRRAVATTSPHFDAAHNFTIQTAGRKEWRVSPSPAEKATRQQVVFEDGEVRRISNFDWEDYEPWDRESALTFVLEPGDLLYVPPGCWHEVAAVGDELSVSSAITFQGRSCADLLHDVFEETLLANASWRELPCRPVTRGEELDPELDRYFDSVLDDLEAFVARARRDRLALHTQFQTLLASPGTLEALPEELGEARSVEPDDVLLGTQCPSPTTIARGEGDEAILYLFHRRGNLAFDDPDLHTFARKLAVTPRFRAGDATSWVRSGAPLEWGSVRDLLESLVGIGFLTVQS